MVELNTSDDTIEELKREANNLAELADHADDDHGKAKFLQIRANVLAGLVRVQRDREAEGHGADEDPEVTERHALEFLRSRGWRCER